MTATQTIRVKNTPEAIRAMIKVTVPTFVIEKILGREMPSDDGLHVECDWLGQHTEWCLPAEAVEIVTK